MKVKLIWPNVNNCYQLLVLTNLMQKLSDLVKYVQNLPFQ